MKIALFSDLHIYPHFGNHQFEDIASNFLIDLLSYCKNESISKAVFCGDFFHLKDKLPVTPFIRAIDILRDFKKNNINITFIIGNHDMPFMDTTDFSIIHAFKEYGTVVPNYEWEDVGNTRLHYLSYTHELPKFEIASKENNILFGHLEISSFQMDGNAICSDGMETSSFSIFNKVFSGHFHKHQLKDNIVYVGSPYQTRFSERFDDKGFIVLDTDTTKWKFVRYEKAPVFKEISIDDISNIDDLKGNFVRLKTSQNNTDLIKIKEKLLSEGVETVDFIYEQDDSENKEINVVENLSLGSIKELASSYWDNIKTSDLFSSDIKEKIDKNELTKDDFTNIFDDIENAYLSNWKGDEE